MFCKSSSKLKKATAGCRIRWLELPGSTCDSYSNQHNEGWLMLLRNCTPQKGSLVSVCVRLVRTLHLHADIVGLLLGECCEIGSQRREVQSCNPCSPSSSSGDQAEQGPDW